MRTNLALVVVLALPVVSCSDSTSSTDLCAPSGAAATVSAGDNLAFTPSTVTVAVGQMVCWQNTGSMTHTTTQTVNPGQIGLWSGNLPPGQTFVFTMNNAGTWAYHCNQHSNMKATVIVTP